MAAASSRRLANIAEAALDRTWHILIATQTLQPPRNTGYLSCTFPDRALSSQDPGTQRSAGLRYERKPIQRRRSREKPFSFVCNKTGFPMTTFAFRLEADDTTGSFRVSNDLSWPRLPFLLAPPVAPNDRAMMVAATIRPLLPGWQPFSRLVSLGKVRH